MRENKFRKKKLAKNTLIIAVGKVSTQLINFLLLPLYTYKLSTQDYGDFDFISTVSYFLLPLFTLLFEESMFRFLIDNKEEKETIISTAFLSMLQTLLLFTMKGSDLVPAASSCSATWKATLVDPV